MVDRLGWLVGQPVRVENAVGAGWARGRAGQARELVWVHVLLLWSDGVVETGVHAVALEWTREAVHVQVYGRGAQWLLWLPARHVERCRCDSEDGEGVV